MYKDGGFCLHFKAEHHLNAMLAWTEYQRGVENNTSLLQAMDKQYQKKVAENRKYTKTVADVLLCTASQEHSTAWPSGVRRLRKQRQLFGHFGAHSQA